jgi:hypothetical protein
MNNQEMEDRVRNHTFMERESWEIPAGMKNWYRKKPGLVKSMAACTKQ